MKRICTLDIKLDCKNAEGQTPLIVAITKTPMEHRLAVVKYFVEEQKVNLNILDNKWQSPLTYSFRELKSASDQKQHEVLQYILDHWQFPETKMMNYWIDECLRFAEDKTLSINALEIAVNHILALNVGKKYYNHENLHKGIGHVFDYQGKTIKETETEIKDINLSLWNPRAFLALRVRVLLSFLVQQHTLPTTSRKLNLIRHELYYTVYAFFINELMIEIHNATHSDQSFLRGLLINKIFELFARLPSEGECIIPIGWSGHVLYLCLQKSQGRMVLRLDNTDLLSGLDRHPPPTHNNLFSPVVIASIPFDKIDTPPLLRIYLQTVFQHRFIKPTSTTHQDKILNDIYGKSTLSSQLASTYRPQQVYTFPRYAAQKANTCTMSGFQVGFRIRHDADLEQDLQTLEITFFREQLKEHIVLTGTQTLPPSVTMSVTPLPYSLELKLLDESEKISVTRVTDSKNIPITDFFSDLYMTSQENKDSMTVESKELKTIATPMPAQPLTDWYDNPNIAFQQIVISGASGTGKTTLCLYIKSQWGKTPCRLRGINRFTAILHLPISALSNCKTELSLLELLNKLCFTEKLSNIQLWFLKKALNANQILLLLDGANELVNITQQSIEAKNYQQLLNYSNCILTSQPLALYRIPMPESGQVHRQYLKLHGFSLATTYTHIQKLFPDDKAPESVLDTLRTQPLLQQLCRSPLLLELYSYLAQETKETLTVTSQSTLLIDMLGYLLKIHLPSCSSTPISKLTYQNSYDHPSTFRIMTIMGELALRHIELGGILIEKETIDTVCQEADCIRTLVTDDILSFRILKVADRDDQGISSVYFTHEFFRNYSAAYIITQKMLAGHPEAITLVNTHRYDFRFRSIWPAVVGWLAFFYQQRQTIPVKQQKITYTLKNFIGTLQNFIGKDICGFFAAPLLLECLAECPVELYREIPDLQKLYTFLGSITDKLCDSSTEDLYSQWLSILKNYPSLLEQTQLMTALQKKVNGGIDSETKCRAVCHLISLATHSDQVKNLTAQINTLEQYAKTGTNTLLRIRAFAALLQWQKLTTELEIKDITARINWQELFNNPLTANSAYQIFSDRQKALPVFIITVIKERIESLESNSRIQERITDIRLLEPLLAYYPLSTQEIDVLLPKLIECLQQPKILGGNIFLINYSLGLTLKMADKKSPSIVATLEEKLNIPSKSEEKENNLPIAIALLTSGKAKLGSIAKSIEILQEHLTLSQARPWVLKAFIHHCRENKDEFNIIWNKHSSFFKGIIQDMPERLLDLTPSQLKFCLQQKELSYLLSRFSLSLERFSVNDLMEIYLAHGTDETLKWVLALLAQRQIAVVIHPSDPHCIMLHGENISSITNIYQLSDQHMQKLQATTLSMELEQKNTLTSQTSSAIQTSTLRQGRLVCQFFVYRHTTNIEGDTSKKRKREDSSSSQSNSSSTSSSSSSSSSSNSNANRS